MKQYARDRILLVLESVGYKILNKNSDAPIYYLQHEEGNQIVLIDKEPEKFPEDYVREKINPQVMNFDVFTYLYEQSKIGKKQKIKRSKK